MNRAWWALSGSQKKPSASKCFQEGWIDTTPVRTTTLARSQPAQPPPRILKDTSNVTPQSLETTRTSEASSRHVLESSLFAFFGRIYASCFPGRL